MANEDQRDVSLRFSAEGAATAQANVDALAASINALAAQVGKLKEHVETQTKAFEGLAEKVHELHSGFETGKGTVEGFGGALNALSGVISAATSPLGLLTIGLGAAFGAMEHFNNIAVATFRSIRQLEAVSGASAEEAHVLQAAMERMGVSGEAANRAMFRLGFELERGGQGLKKFGLEARTAENEMKTPFEVFLEMAQKISALPDATSQAAASMAAFGRTAGGALAPVLRHFDDLKASMDKIKDEHILGDNFMEDTKKLIAARADMERGLMKEKLAIAEVTMEWEKWLTTVPAAVIGAVKRMVVAFDVAHGLGGGFGIGGLFLGKEQAQGILDAEAAADKAAKAGEAAAKARKDFADKEAHGKLDDDYRLTEEEARIANERVRTQSEQALRVLRGEAVFQGELAKLRTGSQETAVQKQIEYEHDVIRIANERYDQELAIAERTVFKTIGGTVREDMQNKMQKERDDAVISAGERIKLLEIKQGEAAAAREQKLAADSIKLTRDTAEERIVVISATAAREAAILHASSEDALSVMLRTARIEMDALRSVTEERLRQNAAERDLIGREAAKHPDNQALQERAQIQQADLARQRVKIEEDANTKIVQSRAKMIEQLDALAKKEAALGGNLTALALGELKKEGNTQASTADINRKIEEMRRSASQTAAMADQGYAVSLEDLENAMRIAPAFGQWTDIGRGSAPGQTFLKQMINQLSGVQERMTPSMLPAYGGMDRYLGGEQAAARTSGIGEAVAAAFGSATEKFSQAVEKFASMGSSSGAPSASAVDLPGTYRYVKERLLADMGYEALRR